MNFTQEERTHIGQLIVRTYKAYGKDIEREVVRMMIDDLEGNLLESVVSALSAYRRNAKNKFPPTIADILALLAPQVDDHTRAVEISSRVLEAVAKYGWNNSELARAFIGEVGWEAVKRYGGWMRVCENLGDTIDVTTFAAQIREVAKAQLLISAAGRREDPTLLDFNRPQVENNKPKELQSAADVIKSIMPPSEKE